MQKLTEEQVIEKTSKINKLIEDLALLYREGKMEEEGLDYFDYWLNENFDQGVVYYLQTGEEP